MRSRTKWRVVLPSAMALLFAGYGVSSAPSIPKPVIYFTGPESFEVNGKKFVKYHFDVCNKNDFPAQMFAPAPQLPPCGRNTNASRTWIDFFDQKGNRLYGFCNIYKPADLNQIWFALEEGALPPASVYVEFNDRQTDTKYKSNLAVTTQ